MDIHTHIPLTTYRLIYTYTQYVITHICIHIYTHVLYYKHTNYAQLHMHATFT